MKIYKISKEDYQGNHTAPDKTSGDPLHNLQNTYPDDIYSNNAAQNYGHYGQNHPLDQQAISIIQTYHNKPNKQITIYRAVPNLNIKNENQIKELNRLLHYHNKFSFFPVNNPIIRKIEENYPIEKYPYNTQQQLITQNIENQISTLKSNRTPSLTINNGDWVTINKEYAKMHGESELKGQYKIIPKIVKAKDIYTNGDSILEWGYDP